MGLAADLQYPGALDDFDGDAAFDALWNVCSNGANNGLEYQDDCMMWGGNSPLDPYAEPSNQTMSSLNSINLQELIHPNHESTSTHKNSPSGEVGVGMKSLFLTLQMLCSPV